MKETGRTGAAGGVRCRKNNTVKIWPGALLRQVHPEDARAMLTIWNAPRRRRITVRLPEEVTFSLEEEQALLADCLSSDRRIMLAAFAERSLEMWRRPGRRTI